MRTAIMLVLSAGIALAQPAPNPCQSQEDVIQRYKVLREKSVISVQQLDEAQAALAQCQAHSAELKASEQAKLAKAEDLRNAVGALNRLTVQAAQQQVILRDLTAEEKADQAKLDELHKRYTDSYPEVQALKAELEAVRAQRAAFGQAAKRPIGEVRTLKLATGGLQPGLPDRWWKNPPTAQSLGLTADQQKKMDDTFQQYRLKLIDLNATLEKEEVILEPMVAAGPLDETKITSQIDRVAQARAELEKANGRMLLGIRKQLTPEQWSKLNQSSPGQK